MFDPALGRFFTQDRFAEKYLDLTPYQYGANNPINNIDINGDSICFAGALVTDPNAVKNVQKDLSDQTGLTLSVDSKTGQMSYATTTNKKGKVVPLVAQDANGKSVGSKTARKMITKAIDNKKKTVQVFATTRTGSKGGGLQININSTQISNMISGTSSDLDSRTMGFGMTFLHELGHTDLGGNRRDPQAITFPNGQKGVPFGSLGTNVPFINTIRKELGGSYGRRSSYGALPVNGNIYLPFSNKSSSDLQRGIVPVSSYLKL